MQFDQSAPIYLQVVTEIKKDIVAGRRLPGEKLPSGRDLALLFKINPNTAARVYQVLETEGICYTKRGLGTFISEEADMKERLKKEMAEELLRHFLENMEALGYTREEIKALLKEEK